LEIEKGKIVLTGAAGGIGQPLTELLAGRNCRIALIDADETAVCQLAEKTPGAIPLVADLSSRAGCASAASRAVDALGGADVLINLAGLMSFSAYENEDPERLERLMYVNLIAPMLLCREILPCMLEQGSGHIAVVGSMFGSIGYPYFTSYSASKFGLRGFSQALRRELSDRPVSVSYISPRAVKTSINAGQVEAMNTAMKMPMDEPTKIARRIIRTIEADEKETYIGFPESVFARINGIMPGVVDSSLTRQVAEIRTFASPTASQDPARKAAAE